MKKKKKKEKSWQKRFHTRLEQDQKVNKANFYKSRVGHI